MEYLKLLGLILLVYLAVYSIISRVCDCIERSAYAKHGVYDLMLLQNNEASDNQDNQNEKSKEVNNAQQC